MNIFIPLRFEGYSYASQTVSELSAIGAPTRSLWVAAGMVYILLFAAFGWGVRLSAAGNHRLRVPGTLIFIYSVIDFYWPPMQLRGNEMKLTDTLHIAWAMATILLMLLMMGFGAAAPGKRFRIYTHISIAVFIVFGVLTGIEGPKIASNEPTPLIGVWERINIAVFMLWVAVLAVVLLRRQKTTLSHDE
jgi:hypothetical protein